MTCKESRVISKMEANRSKENDKTFNLDAGAERLVFTCCAASRPSHKRGCEEKVISGDKRIQLPIVEPKKEREIHV